MRKVDTGQISTIKDYEAHVSGVGSSSEYKKAKGRKRASLSRKPLQNAGSDCSLSKVQGRRKFLKNCEHRERS